MMNCSQAQTNLMSLLGKPLPALPPLPKPDTEFVIYGAGNCGRDVLRVLRTHGYRVAAFLDARADSLKSVDGVVCVRPDTEQARACARSGCPVAMGIFNCSVDLLTIHSLLEQAGFRWIISYYEMFEFFPDNLRSRYWLTPRDAYADRARELRDTLSLLGDDRSQHIYLELLELRLTGNLELLRHPDRHCQYLPADLPPLAEPVRLVDGGAFVGDTLQSFVDRQSQLEAVAAFEPDPSNFRQLHQFVRRNLSALGAITLFPCALGADTAMKRFASGQGGGSGLDATGDSFIQVVALDDALPTFAPTLIKFDIEGAELEALCGAAEMIRRYRPRLAVCVYHAPDHLWQVPQLMHQLVPGHRLALRYHQFNGFDVVAYAFPS